METVNISLQLPKDTYAALDSAAKECHLSVNNLLVERIHEFAIYGTWKLNKKTIAALEQSRKGKGLLSYSTLDSLFNEINGELKENKE